MRLQVLNNKMTILSEANNKVSSITIALYFRGGTAYENSRYRGITHLMEHMMFRSLSGLEQGQLYEKLRQMGTMMYATTYMDCVEFDISILPEHFKQAIHILNCLLDEQKWTMEDIELEKNVVIKQIEEKGGLSFSDAVNRLGFKTSPWYLGIMGTKTMVKRTSRKALMNWQRTVCNPANACFIMTGAYTDKDFDYALNLLGKHCIKCEPFSKFVEIPPAAFNRGPADDRVVPCDCDISDVSIWFDVSKKNREIADLISFIITDLGSSISLELREKKAWVIEFDTYVDHNVSFSRFMIEFSVASCYLVESLNYLFHTIKNISQYLTLSELSAAKAYWKFSADTLKDRPRDLCHDIAWGQFVTGPDSFFPYQNISFSTFQQGAMDIFKPQNMFVYIECDSNRATIKNIKKVLSNFREEK